MTESEILSIIRAAPANTEGRWAGIVERASRSLGTMAHRLADDELEAIIGLVALCFQKASGEQGDEDEFRALMLRLQLTSGPDQSKQLR